MKWAYIIDGSEMTSVSDNRCHFLESEITEIDIKTTEQEISGVDGILAGHNSFGPFELSLKFYYDGADNSDLILFTEKIKRIIYTRNAMYVAHSDMPGRKYAFNSAKIEWEKITSSDMTFSIIFNCFKGYSESLKETDEFSLSSGEWQLENGLLADDSIKYKHNTTRFKIFNGSSDTIAPFPHRHKLIIKLNVNAPKGFKLINRTTGDVFEYKKAITKSKQIIINGIYPTIDGKRVGIDTNHEWLTLAPGYNDIEIIGTDITEPNAQFIFPFIYR